MRSGFRITTRKTCHQVRTGQLTELHAEQRSTGLIDFLGIEIFLHNLACNTRTECIALGRQVSTGDCLGNDSERIRQDIDLLQTVRRTTPAISAPGVNGKGGFI